MEGRDPSEARRDPAGVQAEIERAQRRLAWAVDEIVDRTSPRNVAQRSWGRVRDSGTRLFGGARALVTGDAVRLESHVVEPPEGTVMIKGDGEVVSTYAAPRSLPTEAVLLGAGAGLVVTIGLVAMWRRHRKQR
ncbi:hypothetical protein F4561_000814 [Lipingzhangella halophila]|uniref:DUF3618 domain-containing protein n=1 Tax=Lipingzhangella halophila TaxID=1783352 RepID=A0A7W7RDL9_9ACTN|nr:DUF3618 domain-containing protein [Lipingzhangella halophila]MBB4929994.1 hypothetical protein [Lipingzhangella halophila]